MFNVAPVSYDKPNTIHALNRLNRTKAQDLPFPIASYWKLRSHPTRSHHGTPNRAP